MAALKHGLRDKAEPSFVVAVLPSRPSHCDAFVCEAGVKAVICIIIVNRWYKSEDGKHGTTFVRSSFFLVGTTPFWQLTTLKT
jgi:hypothetical protein